MTQRDDSYSRLQIGLTMGADKDTAEPGHAMNFMVVGTYEGAMERIMPTSPPSSALAQRELCTWELAEGGRVFILPQNIAWVLEVEE